MSDVRITVDPASVRALAADPAVQREVGLAADGLARLGAAGAPKRTGAGAASIQGRRSTIDPTVVGVAWDAEHYYLRFPEFGTEHQPAQRFLTHAYETYIHV